jgi:hypothetical protein
VLRLTMVILLIFDLPATHHRYKTNHQQQLHYIEMRAKKHENLNKTHRSLPTTTIAAHLCRCRYAGACRCDCSARRRRAERHSAPLGGATRNLIINETILFFFTHFALCVFAIFFKIQCYKFEKHFSISKRRQSFY